MDSSAILIVVMVGGLGGLGALAYMFLGTPGSRSREIRGMMASTGPDGAASASTKTFSPDDLTVEQIKLKSGSSNARVSREDINRKLFRAGYYSRASVRKFEIFRRVLPVVMTPLVFVLLYRFTHNPGMGGVGAMLGFLVGYATPLSWLDREIRNREEEIMYYLPLVIEQVSIGVSSSLDIGPCIGQIVSMADERDSHNAVTEMFVHVEKLIRSGLSLDQALLEVGDAVGTPEVKHAFMFLSQCAKHGGEVSKQLQDLADAVTVQRQVHVEGRITALPVKATGPLTVVFAGFFAILLAGLFVRIMGAFGGGVIGSGGGG